MKTDTFTLIAYRENGIDTCRGCLMAQSDSDLQIHTYDSIEDIAQSIYKYKEINANKDREYYDYDLTILINGKDQYAHISDEQESERIAQLYNNIYNHEENVKKIEKERQEEEQRLLKIKKEQERLDNIKKKDEQYEINRLLKIEADKKLYEELKLRFENN